jgi:hypothetical protein
MKILYRKLRTTAHQEEVVMCVVSEGEGKMHLGSGTGEYPNIEEGEGREEEAMRDMIVREETRDPLFQ